jgi:hypothetical protein
MTLNGNTVSNLELLNNNTDFKENGSLRLEMLDERGEGDEDELGQVERISSYGEEEASFRVG